MTVPQSFTDILSEPASEALGDALLRLRDISRIKLARRSAEPGDIAMLILGIIECWIFGGMCRRVLRSTTAGQTLD